MKVLQVCWSFSLAVVVASAFMACYATAATATAEIYKKPPLKHVMTSEEVTSKTTKLQFGAKTTIAHAQPVAKTAYKSKLGKTKQRKVPRDYDAAAFAEDEANILPPKRVITQYKIPLQQKSNKVVAEAVYRPSPNDYWPYSAETDTNYANDENKNQQANWQQNIADGKRVKLSSTSSTTEVAPTVGVAPSKNATDTSSTSNNPFEIFVNFWNLISARESPKAIKSETISNTNERSKDNKKQKKPTNAKTEITTKSEEVSLTDAVTEKHKESEPFRIALPTFGLFDNGNQGITEAERAKKRASTALLRQLYNCPRESEVRFQLFPKICKTDKDCSVWNRDELCCDIFGSKSCVNGMPKPLEETSHAPFFGVIPRKCPNRPLAELWWSVQECETDTDCWPRLCCPDGRRRYCRTSQPELETVPIPIKRSFNYLTEYLECTPPPPPIFDLHPKACTSTLDCFPNVCCQEAGLRHCRPPKKSVLTLMANVLNVDFVRQFAKNIVIK